LTIGFVWFRSSKNLFIAGMLFGVAAFRFQVVLPIVLCFLLWRRWKVVLGFSIMAFAVAILSVAIAGFRPYVDTILRLSLQPEMAYLGPVWRMPNLRGLIRSLGGNDWMVLVASLSILAVAAVAGARRGLQQQLGYAVTVATLVAYHGFVYDLSILLIPLALLISQNQPSAWVVTGICFLTPSLFMFVPDHLYLAAFAVLGLFCFLSVELFGGPDMGLSSNKILLV
jgi:hypothetical protein